MRGTLLLLAVMAWYSAEAAPPVWMPIADLPNAKRSLDVANIVSRGTIREVWLRDDPAIPAGLFDMAKTWNYPKPNELDYELTLTRFDCEARMSYMLSMFLYSKGQVVRSVDNGSQGVPSPVVPGSVGDTTYDIVCRPPVAPPSTKKRARAAPV